MEAKRACRTLKNCIFLLIKDKIKTYNGGWTPHGRKHSEIWEKLKQLVAHGKKNKSILELQEINDFFSDMELDAEQMEKVYEYLEANHIDVLRVSGDGDGIEELDDVDDSDMF